MSSFDAPRLDKAEEDAVRALHKSVRATAYEDPVDQDAFLIASARSVLQFRKQVASFALTPEVGECVFTIRSKLAQNNSRLGAPPDDIFSSITNFAGEIARSRQLYRDRKRAKAARLRAEEGVAARAEHREALEYAAKLQNQIHSPDEDAVSIPSAASEDDDVRERAVSLVAQPPSATIKIETTGPASPIPVCPIALLSPLPELEGLMLSIRLSNPPSARLASPLSPSPSLPDLVPIVSPLSSPPANGRARMPRMMNTPLLYRGRTVVRKPPNTRRPAPPASPASNVAVLVPRPAKFVPRRPKFHYVDDLRVSRPRSIGSHARKDTPSGSYRRSRTPSVTNRNAKAPKHKRCFFCSATSHFIANCPLREID
ncbi:hypothetical protein FB451DRAFT_1556526 [Mycena latifolia]|nr:hypothetical protein FB451DRAFT_1556526 [Mycena latifolia]